MTRRSRRVHHAGRVCSGRIRHRAHAVVLLDMVFTLILVGVLMTVVVQLIGTLLRTSREIADTGRQSATIDRALSLLRRDVLQAPALQPLPGGFDAGQGTTWQADADALVRKSSAGEERFGPLPKAPKLVVSRDVVHVHLGDDHWALRRLTLEGP